MEMAIHTRLPGNIPWQDCRKDAAANASRGLIDMPLASQGMQ
jgi:hypothetical protein